MPLDDAQIYDDHFVPALFGPWGERHAALARIDPGHHVLDVACGTGALACAASKRAGPSGTVTGLDANPDMLAVARAKPARVTWVEGLAEALPFDDAQFDRVVSQFGMMFFEDPAAAIREVHRVVRPGGQWLVAVCDGLDHSPGYAVFTELLHRLFGADVAEAFRAPFRLGDRDVLADIAAQAGVPATVERFDGLMRFPSIEALVSAERACAWTLGGLLDEDQFGRLTAAAEESLRPFVAADGALAFDVPSLVLQGSR